MTRNSAYTLIEILVGITIIGLVFGFGFVSFREFSRRQAVAGAVKQIKGDLRLAQAYALSGKRPTDCQADERLDGFSFTVISGQNYEIKANCATSVTKSMTLSGELSMSFPSPNPIIFKVLGQGTNIPLGGNATITLTQTGTNNQAVITISASGEIK